MSLIFFKDPFTHSFFTNDFFSPRHTEDSFEINLNVKDFNPEELKINLTEDGVVIVEGKHEDKKDQNGSISRHFVKKCAIPEGFDVGKIQSKLYGDGVLSVRVPRLQNRDKNNNAICNIPVTKVKGEVNWFKSKL